MSSIKSARSLETYGRSLRPKRTILFSGSAGTVTCPSTGINISKRLQNKREDFISMMYIWNKDFIIKDFIMPHNTVWHAVLDIIPNR